VIVRLLFLSLFLNEQKKSKKERWHNRSSQKSNFAHNRIIALLKKNKYVQCAIVRMYDCPTLPKGSQVSNTGRKISQDSLEQ